MDEKETEEYFLLIYEQTYGSCLRFLTSKCGNLSDLPDLLQETYLELYNTLKKKGKKYIKQPEALVITIAKRKLIRHYSLIDIFRQKFTSLDNTNENESCDMQQTITSTVEWQCLKKEEIDEIWKHAIDIYTSFVSENKDTITAAVIEKYLEKLEESDKVLDATIETFYDNIFEVVRESMKTK